jgi:polyisoprenoid-binding protein YceI
MFDGTGPQTAALDVPRRSSRKRHWRRWLLAGAGALVVLIVLAVAAFIKLQPSPSPLVLPTAAASAPAGPLDGTWGIAAGSVAGFRVPETALGISNDIVGRTNAVHGTMAFSGTRVTAAAFRIDLVTIKVGGKTQPQFAKSLGTQDHPSAAFTLTQPVTLGSTFTSGATVTATATGRLTLRGISHLVTVTISGRRNGTALQVAGSIPVAFSGWGIKGPKGYGFFGSVANHGVAEFLLILHRQ